MAILITGSNGLIGKSLTYILLKKNKNIICLDKSLSKETIINKKIKKIELNILNKKDLFKKLKSTKFDTIIHLAAFLGVKKTEKDQSKCLKINIEGTKNILEVAKVHKVKKIIFASSSEVYGNGYKSIMKESDKLMPKSSYGVSKVTCEDIIKSYSEKHDANYNILRFFNVYGVNQREDFVISKFAKEIKNRTNLKVYGTGSQIRCFCHVEDAVKGIYSVLKKGKKNTTYNVGNNYEPISIFNLAQKINSLSGNKVKIKKISFTKSDWSIKREIFYRKPDISKINRDTNYKPQIKLDNGLLEMI